MYVRTCIRIFVVRFYSWKKKAWELPEQYLYLEAIIIYIAKLKCTYVPVLVGTVPNVDSGVMNKKLFIS